MLCLKLDIFQPLVLNKTKILVYRLEMKNSDNIASTVRKYLDLNPDLWKAIDVGIVNYSALARIVSSDTGIDNLEAISAALKRVPKSGFSNSKYRKILKDSTIETRSSITVAILKPSTENLRLLINLTRNLVESYTEYRIIQATQGCGLVIGDDLFRRISSMIPKKEIIEITQGLGELIIISSPEILHLKGYVSYSSSLLSNHGINIIQIVSFHNDITFILNPKDVLEAMRIFMQEKEL